MNTAFVQNSCIARYTSGALLAACLVSGIDVHSARAQGVQAARGMAGSRTQVQQAAREYLVDVKAAATIAFGLTAADSARVRTAFNTVVTSADRALNAGEGDSFQQAYADFREAANRACSIAGTDAQYAQYRDVARCGPVREVGGIQESSAQVPAIFVSVPDVVFTVGYEYTTARKGRPGYGGVSIGTNLLGAAVGTAFDAIGSNSLKTYFTDNLSAGFSIPTDGGAHMSGALAVGLGGFSFRGISFWPTFSMEQLDSADSRVPAQLLTDAPKETRWSQPALSVAIAYPKLLERVSNGQLGFIGTVGIRLPHYYAGDTFTALGAIFSSRRSDFKRAGRGQLTLGVAIPLLRVKPVETKGSSSGDKNESDESPKKS